MTDRTVREDGSGSSGNRTVREGSGSFRTVRENAHWSTVREGGAGATLREGGGAPVSDGGAGPAWLPGSLAGRFEVVEELPTRGSEADLYVVADPGGRRFVAKVYRRGIQPKEEILRILQRAEFDHVVQLEEFGEDDGRWWELIEYIEHSSLKALIDQEGPKLPDATARQVLQELNDALTHLHGLPIEHRDLKPDNVLVRTREPLDLVLADFGIASVMDASVRFTDTARTIRYAPPEAIGSIIPEDEGKLRNVVAIARTRWDYWSLGMIVVEMLTGEHPYSGISEAAIGHRLATQNVDELVEGIEQEGWRKLCRGLLRRDPGKRWGSEQVSLWLKNERDPRLKVEDEVVPSEQTVRGIDFDGRSFTSPESLGTALSEDWSKAESFWKRRLQDLQTWIIDTLGQQARGKALDAIDKDQRRKIDAQVFSFIYILAPSAPLRFKGVELSRKGLERMAERALDGDPPAKSTLLSLYENDILTLASALEQGKDLSAIAHNWREAVSDYRAKRQDMERHGARAPALEGDTLVKLLAAAIPVSSVVSELRAAAKRTYTADARECPWFGNLGEPEKASVGSLMIIPHVVRDAEAGARQRRELAAAEAASRRAEAFRKSGLVGVIVVALILLIAITQKINRDRSALASASAEIERTIPEGRPGGSAFITYIDGSGGNFLVSIRDSSVYLEIQRNLDCSWTLVPSSIKDSETVIYAANINRNAIGRFFLGTCGGLTNVEISRQSEDVLGLNLVRDGRTIASGAFYKQSYDAMESQRIASLSASVWATSENSRDAQSTFSRWGGGIIMHVSTEGDLYERDQWEFRIEFPDGGWGTCAQTRCRINSGLNDDGSYPPGTYTLRATTKHRTLATSSFTVN